MSFKYLLFYLLIVNIIGFTVAAVDKLLAKKQKRRIKEKTLFLISFLGGALLEYASMRLFHHKTRHKRFMIGLPLIIVLQLAIILFGLYFGVLY